MLKVTFFREPDPPVLRLEGQLSGPWTRELRLQWSELQKDETARCMSVDLSDVTSVSSDGKRLLKEMARQGASLQSQSLMTRFLVSQIQKELASSKGGNQNGSTKRSQNSRNQLRQFPKA